MVNTIAKKKKKKGFTLIELIIVLAIMAILAAIAIPSFNAIRDNSRKRADEHSSETIRKTVQMMVADGTVKLTAGVATTTSSFDKGGGTFSWDTDITSGTTEMQAALADVKAPQDVANVSEYEITIKDDGSVAVKTIP